MNMGKVTEASRPGIVSRVRLKLAGLILGKNIARPEQTASKAVLIDPNNEKPEIKAGRGLRIVGANAKVELLSQMTREMMVFHDVLDLEKSVGSDAIPRLFPRLKVRGVKFLGQEAGSWDIHLNPAQPRAETLGRLIKGGFGEGSLEIMKKAVESGKVERGGDEIALPFMMESNVCGLAVLSGRITQEDVKLAEVFKKSVDSALINAVRLGELYRRAATDPKTGLYNYDHMVSEIRKEIVRAVRTKSDFAVLMVDIDKFKIINDTYGHEAGDDVLRAVAGAMKGTVRSVDSVCRYGGEEFVIILPDTEIQDSLVVAEKVRQEVKNISVKTKDTNGREIELNVSISVGVAGYTFHVPEPEKGREDDAVSLLIRTADRALYAAKGKESGAPSGDRNRTVININGNWMLADEAIRYFEKQGKKEDRESVRDKQLKGK